MDTPARVAQSWLRHRHDLALGIEPELCPSRCDFRAIVGVLAIVLAIAAGFGVARIKVDDSLSQLFRLIPPSSSYTSRSPAYSRQANSTYSSSSMARHCWSAPLSQNFAIWSSICN